MIRKKQSSRIRLGIDFGTTRTLVASVEKGNYPLVTFETKGGEAQDWFPSLIAGRGSQFVFGWEAWSKQAEEGWQKIRSIKRLLSQANPQTCMEVGGQKVPILTLLVGYLSALRKDLIENSNLQSKKPVTFEVMLGVPANANSNQRFLTMEGFRQAGFEVLGMINEPSAAGIEYAFRYRQRSDGPRQEFILVYDLGGGTFDLSVIQLTELIHRVITTTGIECLGGDDFDSILAGLALSQAGLGPELQNDFWLLEECRQRKETLNPNTKKIHIDLSRVLGKDLEVTVTAAEFYEKCLPLVEQTVASVEAAFAQPSSEDVPPEWGHNANLYLVGGAAELPLVSRFLRAHYGRRIRRSPYPRAATAIGLAIAADEMAGYAIQDQFTRHFGVWREAEGGQIICFDPIFSKGTPLPSRGDSPLIRSRRYEPAHNIGYFRYIECSQIDSYGFPTGDITTWDEIWFPFVPELSSEIDLQKIPIQRQKGNVGIQVEEIYTCDSQGIVQVTLTNCATGFERSYRLRRSS